MLDDIISALISVAIALVVALPLGKALKRHPAPFYVAALVLVAAHLAYRYTGTYVAGAQVVVDVMQKGYLACALLAIVMFTGVLDEQTALRRRLQPIRAELSIMSCLLISSHVLAFLPSYLPRLGAIFASHLGMSISIVMACLLSLVFVLLSVMSLRVVRQHMSYKTWKAVQRLSYLMVALLLAHIALALGRPAFAGHGSPSARFALAAYAVLGIAYAVLRVRKALRDRRAAAPSQPAKAEGRA